MIVVMSCVTEHCVEMLSPRTRTNEKVERERCIEYTSGAAEEEFARDC